VKHVQKVWCIKQITQLVAHVLTILKIVQTFNVLLVQMITNTLKTVNAVVFVKKLLLYVTFVLLVWWSFKMVLIVVHVLMILMTVQMKFVKIAQKTWDLLIMKNVVVNALLNKYVKFVQKVWWLLMMELIVDLVSTILKIALISNVLLVQQILYMLKTENVVVFVKKKS
jgi:hypothetical protein